MMYDHDLFKKIVQRVNNDMISYQMEVQMRQHHKRVGSDDIFTDIVTSNDMTVHKGMIREKGRVTAPEWLERGRILWTEILYRAGEPNIGDAP